MGGNHGHAPHMHNPHTHAPHTHALYALDDPHFFTAHGDRFDFRGKDDTVYNLLSHANVSVNALFQTADYTSSGPRHKLVHGSFMRKAFVTVLTNMSHTLRVEYAAARPLTSKATVDGADISASGRSEVNIDNIAVSLNGRTLTIQTPEWLIRVSSKVNPSISNAPSCATGRCILNIQLAPLFDANHARVAPHGLIGQSYDGDSIAVIGQVDRYNLAEVTTSAMGEGAIEGVAAQYEMADTFATSFAFSRFRKTSAPPRNVSELTGIKANSDLSKATPTQAI
eukprot:CAMPEP_0181252516 /NCGR_PEP_ID=MMETSP1096-20121128/47512_1 /TAXON_ID=156174 ORGANISM="Chrysochromulina ericina, Strain CCMP281" /NCGR_SAMPLE_ID=MMETSP1096 /ASSEMBLY_ACC=CAM_ASM_000453 /LENGTH=281 /DNA_ID=CAMNT_0023350291 /DNA_START=295 /DNA_END=1140 /DNA_ORIENTATION=+